MIYEVKRKGETVELLCVILILENVQVARETCVLILRSVTKTSVAKTSL